MEVAVAVFSPLLDVLADVPDPCRMQGQLLKAPLILDFQIYAICLIYICSEKFVLRCGTTSPFLAVDRRGWLGGHAKPLVTAEAYPIETL